LRALAEQSNAWPFEQAKAIVARLKKNPKDEVLFRPAMARPACAHRHLRRGRAHHMVRHAFRVLTEDKIKTRLIAFPTTWTGCARCRTMCRTRRCWRSISAGRCRGF